MKKLVRSRAPLLMLVAIGTMVAWLSIAPQAWSADDLVGGVCDCGTWFHCNGNYPTDCPSFCYPGTRWRCKGYCSDHVKYCEHAESNNCVDPDPACYYYYNVRCSGV